VTATPQQLRIELGGRSYPIVIGTRLLGNPELVGSHVAARDVLVVTNTTIGPLYLDQTRTGLQGKRVRALELPDGEQYKTLDVLGRVFDALV
jgi:3-dehydroquinate synthase